jgi:hypothetical protein
MVDLVEIVGGYGPGVVIRAEARGDLPGIIAFVERGLFETDAAGFDRLAAGLSHQRDDAGAIDPAREKRAKRHVRDHPRTDRLAQQVQ